MVTKRKPKIGLLGIMHGLYDEKQPEVTRNQEKFARDVCKQLKEVADVQFPRAAKTREDIEAITRQFNTDGLDGIMIVMLLYSPGLRTVQALQENRLPVLMANIQPLPTVTQDWNWSLLTTNQGIHGAQDMANMLLRTDTQAQFITDDWKSDNFKAFVGDWAAAAATSQAMKRMRFAAFCRMRGMGDIIGDDFAMFQKLGPWLEYESIGEVYRRMEKVTNAQINAQIRKDRENFQVDPKITEDSHRYAVRLQLGFERLMLDKNFDGFSANFDVFKEDGRFQQIPMLGASNLMAKGYGYSAEGDTQTMLMVAAGHSLIGDAHFTEMYSLDFKRDSALMSHMGEGNWKIARKDRPIKLIDRELEIGGMGNPPTVVFSAQPGPGTMVSLVAFGGPCYRLVITQGEILDTPELKDVPMPYFHFKPSTGIRSSMDNWLKAGGTHHQVLNLGSHVRKWQMLCDILGIESVVV